ncbi:hypothetical protein [Sorangium sp. So ce1000]|uniref:hypothetical protein n=1 Tax=Sorangium sp. So ce1000 TaxID=3133325 RepID=UPI003F60C363
MARTKNRDESAPPADAAGDEQTRSYEVLYRQYLPMAAEIPTAEVQGCRADPRLVLVNVKRGVAAVCGTRKQAQAVSEHLPKVPLKEVLQLPDIARALLFASREALPRAASPKEIERALQEISGPREDLLTQAELFARRGLLDKERVAQIRAGTGKYDMARDGMELAALFTRQAGALKGLHPFSREEIEKLGRTSEWLLENLTPAGARVEVKKKERSSAEDARDRLWTLIVLRHQHLRRIGYYFHGDDFEQITPRLLARVQSTQGGEQQQDPEDPSPIEGEEAEQGSVGDETAQGNP